MKDDDIEYQPLPAEFKARGFHHRLRRREGDVCIFERKAPHHEEAHFEVIVVQRFEERSFPDGRTCPPKEGYPSAEQWGTQGWTYGTFEDAKRRFNSLSDSNPYPTVSDSSDFDPSNGSGRH